MACVPAGTIRADVAVMGGGLAGLSAAIGFARRGRRVGAARRRRTGCVLPYRRARCAIWLSAGRRRV